MKTTKKPKDEILIKLRKLGYLPEQIAKMSAKQELHICKNMIYNPQN